MCHISAKQQLKKGGGRKKWVRTGETAHENAVHNWETNSRTTKKWTKKLPFSRLRLEKKGHLLFPVCGQAWKQILGGLRGRAHVMKSAWKGQVPKEHHYPSAGPSVKQASPCEWAKPEALVPALQGLEFRYRNSGKQFISWFKCVDISKNRSRCRKITFVVFLHSA